MHPISAPVAAARHSARIPVDLPCQLTLAGRTVQGRLIDLSHGGARVAMPLHVSVYQFDRLTTLYIARVGLARVHWRWSRDREVGLQFAAPQLLRRSLDRLFDNVGPGAAIRPTAG